MIFIYEAFLLSVAICAERKSICPAASLASSLSTSFSSTLVSFIILRKLYFSLYFPLYFSTKPACIRVRFIRNYAEGTTAFFY